MEWEDNLTTTNLISKSIINTTNVCGMKNIKTSTNKLWHIIDVLSLVIKMQNKKPKN